MLANYHTHTWRCNHASGEDKAYVEAAIRNGMQVLGFSDHCPWVYPDEFVSHTRMRADQLDEYVSAIEALRQEYKNDITIYIGFESEYIPELMEAQDKLLSGYPIDYMILGEHFTEREPEGPYLGYVYPASQEALLKRYVDLVIEGMESGRYLYCAHPDLCGLTDRDAYDRHYRRLCAYLAAHDIPVEINLLGVVEQRHYTDPHFLKLAAEAGCKAIIGVDAHTPDRLDHRSGMAQCQTMAAMAGLELVDFMPGFGKK